MPNDKPLLDSDAMYRKLMETGEVWADAKAAYQALDDASASVLASVTQTYREQKDGLSKADADILARRSSVYRDHLARVSVAHKEFLHAQVRYDSLKTLVELRRSEESTRRAELRL